MCSLPDSVSPTPAARCAPFAVRHSVRGSPLPAARCSRFAERLRVPLMADCCLLLASCLLPDPVKRTRGMAGPARPEPAGPSLPPRLLSPSLTPSPINRSMRKLTDGQTRIIRQAGRQAASQPATERQKDREGKERVRRKRQSLSMSPRRGCNSAKARRFEWSSSSWGNEVISAIGSNEKLMY